MTSASSCAKSSIAPCTTPAASGSPSASSSSSFFLLMSSLGVVAERVVAGLAQRLAPVLDDVAERALAGAVAEEAFVVLDLDVVAVDLDRRQARGAVRGDGRQSLLFGHWVSSLRTSDNAQTGESFRRSRLAPRLLVAGSISRKDPTGKERAMAGEFEGKVVVVTGGSRGIGRAIAAAFAREGAQTVLAATDRGRLAEAAKAITAAGAPEPLTVDGDLSEDRELRAAVRARSSERFKRCDVLVNNAGATVAGNFVESARR